MLKIQIISPLVTIKFEDENEYTSNGYIKHSIPKGDEIYKLIDKLTASCKEIISNTIIAHNHGVIDLKKYTDLENINEIKITTNDIKTH